MKLRRRLPFLIALAAAAGPPAAHAVPVPRAEEPLFGDAVLAYRAGDRAKSLALLQDLLARAPDATPALELKALLLKGAGKDAEARLLYESLLKQATRDKVPVAEGAAPYSFELGLLDYRARNFRRARAYLTRARAARFNSGASDFFLGLIDLQENSLPNAEIRLESTLQSDAEALKPLAHHYLAYIASRDGDTERTIRHLLAANEATGKDSVSDELKPLYAQVAAESTKALGEFSVPKFFGSAALVASYDSNVLSVPSAGAVFATPSGSSSGRGTVKAALGYTSSPMSDIQIVPSYQGSVNINANPATKSGQFVTHDVTVYLNHHPYSATSYGAKVEGISVFQYQVDPDSLVGTYGPYSLGASIGPYFKQEILPRQYVTVEAFFQPTHYYLDPAFSPTARRSGYDVILRPSFYWERHSTWWNPAYTLTAGLFSAEGSEYSGRGVAVGINDTLRWNDLTRGFVSAEAGYRSFPDRPLLARKDETFTLGAGITREVSPKTLVSAELQYQLNLSNVTDVYQYSRLQFSVGVVFSL